jgi:hypothetical protein
MSRTTVIFGSFLLLGGVARAAAPGADELVARGLELRRQAKPQEALETFRRAHALGPSARTFGQMGLVEASLERWLDADAHVAAALGTPDDVWVKRNRAFLYQARRVVSGHIGELVITGPAATDVAVGGKRVGTLPAVGPIRLVEGDAVVTASGAGFKEFSKTVKIVGGAKVALAIVLDPIDERPAVALAAPSPLPAPAPPALTVGESLPTAWRTWTGASLTAAGAALAAWGIVWIAVDGEDRCAIGGPACQTVYDTKRAGWILAAGGAAAVAGGVAMLLAGHGDERQSGANVALAATPTSLLLRALF